MKIVSKRKIGIASVTVFLLFIFSLTFSFLFLTNVKFVAAPTNSADYSSTELTLTHLKSDPKFEIVFDVAKRISNEKVWLEGTLRCKDQDLPNSTSCTGAVPFKYKDVTTDIASNSLPFSFNVTVPAVIFEKFNVTFGSATDIWVVSDATYHKFNTIENLTATFKWSQGGMWKTYNTDLSSAMATGMQLYTSGAVFYGGGAQSVTCNFIDNSTTNPIVKSIGCMQSAGTVWSQNYFFGNITETLWGGVSAVGLSLEAKPCNSATLSAVFNGSVSAVGAYQTTSGIGKNWMAYNSTSCSKVWFFVGYNDEATSITTRYGTGDHTYGVDLSDAGTAKANPMIYGWVSLPIGANQNKTMIDVLRQYNSKNSTLQFGNRSGFVGSIISPNFLNITPSISDNKTNFTFNPQTFVTYVRIGNFTRGATTVLYLYNTSNSTSPQDSDCFGRVVNETGTWNFYTCYGGPAQQLGSANNATGITDYGYSDRSNNFVLWLPIYNISTTVSWLIDDTSLGGFNTSEQNARTAIEQGIVNALGSSTRIFTDQQIYIRNASNYQQLSRFDKVTKFGPQYWAFNYVTGNDAFANMPNVSSALYVLEMSSKSYSDIMSTVQNFIAATKIS